MPKKKQKRTPNEEIIFQEGRLFGLTQGMQTCNKLMAQKKKSESFEVTVSQERDKRTGEMRTRIKHDEPRGVEKDLMDWANDPFSSANTEDPVDSLEEEIRNLPHYSAKVLASGGIHATSCVAEEDVMRAIRHYRAKIWELKEKGKG